MGRKTSVYLADDILAALAKDPRPLAEVIRAGLTGTSLTARAWHGLDDSDARAWPLRPGDRLVFGEWQLEVLPGVVGRGRTMAVVEQLRAHGGEIILAEAGQPEPEPDLGPRIIDLGQGTVTVGQPVRVVDLHAEQRAAAAQAAAAAEAARNAPPRELVQPDWRSYVSEEAHAALQRHGYPADFAPRGVTGDPGFSFRSTMRGPDGELVDVMLRNRVCQLDGVEVDGHAPSDLDPWGGCMFCGADLGGDDG